MVRFVKKTAFGANHAANGRAAGLLTLVGSVGRVEIHVTLNFVHLNQLHRRSF
jgi:hypothetical protein